MSNILPINSNDQMYTSREIAEWTGKQHKTILRDIRDEIEKLNDGEMQEFAGHNFVLVGNTSSGAISNTYYNLTKIGVQQLAMRYDAVIRAKVNMKLEELSTQTQIDTNQLSPELRALNGLIKEINANYLQTQKIANKVESLSTRSEAQQKQIDTLSANINSIKPDFYSVKAYASIRKKSVNRQEAQTIGKIASKMCKKENISPEKIKDTVFGYVNGYPEKILKQIFDLL